MSLQVDDWSSAQALLEADGWIIAEYSRYDPTHVVGLTPNGRAFTLDCVGDTITVTVAGRTRTLTVAKANWLQGMATRTRLLEAWQQLPANQR